MKDTITIQSGDQEIEVEFNYDYDPGIHTHLNGDPGHPPHTEIDILSIHWEGVNVTNLVEMLNDMVSWSVQVGEHTIKRNGKERVVPSYKFIDDLFETIMYTIEDNYEREKE